MQKHPHKHSYDSCKSFPMENLKWQKKINCADNSTATEKKRPNEEERKSIGFHMKSKRVALILCMNGPQKKS